VVVIAGNGPRTAGRSGPPVRHSGKAEGEKVLLSWGFSVTDPDSGTADLATTTAWVNDHFRKLLILKDFGERDR